jgi:hypothetical protein
VLANVCGTAGFPVCPGERFGVTQQNTAGN